jgi:hypothetical protein
MKALSKELSFFIKQLAGELVLAAASTHCMVDRLALFMMRAV